MRDIRGPRTWLSALKESHPAFYVGSIILALVMAYALSGCSSIGTFFSPNPNQTTSPTGLYRRDMVLTVNGVAREGMIVMPLKVNNSIHVKAPNNLDSLIVDTCSGEMTKPQSWNVTAVVSSGLFGWDTQTVTLSKEAQFNYTATGMQLMGSCPMTLQSESADGTKSWGFIDFKTNSFQLQGTMIANMYQREFDGVEAFQTRAGLYSELHFTEEVFMSPDKGCEMNVSSGKDFVWTMPSGWCVYRIKGKTSGKIGKLTTFGYDGILVRTSAQALGGKYGMANDSGRNSHPSSSDPRQNFYRLP